MHQVLVTFGLLLSLAAVGSAQEPAAQRGEAEALVSVGIQAMKEADGDPRRGVDAALAFSHALEVYQQIGDNDAVCEMQANIYWCKKRMNLDNLQQYVAQKGTTAAADFTKVERIINEEVPVTEASAYLDRALRFQSAHPDKHFQIAIRFSEIIERFPDSDAAKEASPAFVREQTAYLNQVASERKVEQAQVQEERQQLRQEIEQIRRSRFMRPPSVSTRTVAVPEKVDQERALATIRSLYKDDYLKRRDAQKRTVAKKFYSEAANNMDDAAIFYVLLDESTRLAMESEDYEQLLLSIERRAETFKGFDEVACKRLVLGKIKSKPTAGAILKLMEDPKDRHANTIVGRFFCFDMERWDLGLPMMSLGDDADLHRVAELEINGPKDSGEQRATGDAWYDLGRKASGEARVQAWTRARHWYAQALVGAAGVNKALMEKRRDEIDTFLPETIIDFANLSPRQWDKIKGQLITVPEKVDRSNGGMALTAGMRVRAVPHPDDQEKVVFKVGSGERQPPGIIQGVGQLWVIPTGRQRRAADRVQLRIKLVVLGDDD
ncbi:MAG: hypothetical protein H0V44_17565 [Planctomycetes bacterium]|nr:hypothetical protein [Planctomycetota bacterium]